MSIKDLQNFFDAGRNALRSLGRVYLTECRGCCGRDQTSSYRIFREEPKIDDCTTYHADSCRNESILIAKIYDQDNGELREIAESLGANSMITLEEDKKGNPRVAIAKL